METKIITLVNQKGGCGKTTVCMQLAGALGREGCKVLVVDADTQGTASRWAACADEKTPFPAMISGMSAIGSKVHQEVKKYIGQYEYIFIDCPPAYDSLIPQSALLIADVALIPVIPSPADIWAAKGIQQLIERVQIQNEALSAYVIPNMCSHTNLNEDAIDGLSELGMKITATSLGLRTAYRVSSVIGGTVFDLKTESALQAQEEIKSLMKELINKLLKNKLTI